VERASSWSPAAILQNYQAPNHEVVRLSGLLHAA
jgi:hypothetical protein